MNKLLSAAIVLIMIPHTTELVKIPDFIFYGGFLSVFILLLLQGKKFVIEPLYMPMLLSILLSIWLNEIPAHFRVSARALIFLIVVFTVGPFITNRLFLQLRRNVFIYTLLFIRWVVILSFVGYLLKLPVVHNYSGFCGFLSQSMLLGPFAGIASLHYFYWMLMADNKRSLLINLFLMSIAVLTLILTGSRSALGASIVGLFLFLFIAYRHRQIRMFQTAFVMVLLLVATQTIWWPYTERIREKMEFGDKRGSTTASRDLLWTDRVREFRAFPVFGVGFSSYNLDLAKNKQNKKTGTIEPGSSWLFLLSSMGMMGFLSVFIPMTYTIFKAYSLPYDRLRNAFLGSLVALFMAHMLFEGYVVAAGSPLCFMLWLLLSECYHCLIKNKEVDYVNSGCRRAAL